MFINIKCRLKFAEEVLQVSLVKTITCKTYINKSKWIKSWNLVEHAEAAEACRS